MHTTERMNNQDQNLNSSPLLFEKEKNYFLEFAKKYFYTSPDPVMVWKTPENIHIELPISQQIEIFYNSVCIEVNSAALHALHLDSKTSLIDQPFQLIFKKKIDKSIQKFIDNDYKLFNINSDGKLLGDTGASSSEHWIGVVENKKLIRIYLICKDTSFLDKQRDEIQEQTERYKTMLEHMDDLVSYYELFPEPKYTYMSPSVEKLTGYTAEEFYKNTDLGRKIMHPDDRYILDELLSESKFSKKPITVRWIKKDGSLIWTEQRVSPVYDQENRLVAIEWIARDITEKIKAEEEAKATEDKFRTIFEYAPDGYYLNDMRGRFVEGNKAAEEIIGYPKEELIGKSYLELDLLPKKYYAKAAMMLAKNAMGKRTGPNAFKLTRKDGSQIDVEISTHPVKIAGKRVVLGIARDITYRRTMQVALYRSKEILNEAQAIAQIGSWELDLKSNKLEWSDEMFRILDLNPNKTKPSYNYFQSLMHPDDKKVMDQSIQDAIHSKKPYDITMRLIMGDKSQRFVHIRGRIYFDETGKPARSIGTMHDVTTLRTTQTALRQSEEKFLKIFETSPNVMVVSSLQDGKIVEVNPAGLKIVGLSRDKVINKTSVELGLIDSAAREILINKISKDGEYRDLEIPITLPSGEKRVALSYGQLISLNNEKLLFQTLIDITDRKQAEEKVIKNRDDLEQVVKERTKEIEVKNNDLLKKTEKLEGFNKVLLQRENRIIEMKEEVNELCRELGRDIKYPPVWGGTHKKN